MTDNNNTLQKSDSSWYKHLIQAIILVTALFAQGITIFAYMKTEIEGIQTIKAQEVVDKELEKRQPLLIQYGDRILVLEMDKVRKDVELGRIPELTKNVKDAYEQIYELEQLGQSNFRAILRERRRIDQLEEQR